MVFFYNPDHDDRPDQGDDDYHTHGDGDYSGHPNDHHHDDNDGHQAGQESLLQVVCTIPTDEAPGDNALNIDPGYGYGAVDVDDMC